MAVSLRSCLAATLLLAALLPPPARAADDTIYALAADDGSITLSNVPTSRRYKPLVSDGLAWPGGAAGGRQRAFAVGSSWRGRYNDVIDQTARTYGLESALLHAVVSVESGYNQNARSRKGAAGLMQLMPGTARRYGVADVLNPEQNLQGGAMYLRDLLQLFDSDLNLALAAYNAGEGAVARYGKRIPPFRETEDYVPRVLAQYRRYQAAEQATE